MLNEKQIDAIINLIKVILEKQAKYKKMNHKVNKVLHGKNYDIAGENREMFFPIDGSVETVLYETLDIIIDDDNIQEIIYHFMTQQAMEDDSLVIQSENGINYAIGHIDGLEAYLKRNL